MAYDADLINGAYNTLVRHCSTIKCDECHLSPNGGSGCFVDKDKHHTGVAPHEWPEVQ